MTNNDALNDPADNSDAPVSLGPPAPLRFAAIVALLQSVAAIVYGITLAVRDLQGEEDPTIVSDSANAQFIGLGTAVYIWIVFGIVAAGAIALLRGATWGRGLLVFMQILLFAVVFFMFKGGAILLGIVTGLSVLFILGGTLHPQSTAWMATRYGR